MSSPHHNLPLHSAWRLAPVLLPLGSAFAAVLSVLALPTARLGVPTPASATWTGVRFDER